MSGRRDEVAAGLAAVEARVGAACAAAGRPRDDVVLIAVTKTWPATDVRLAAELGCRDVGESRDQEAAPKHAACADLALRWHFVGQLQTNKARSVAAYADVVHSVDRPRLVAALADGARRHGRALRCLVQVALDASPGEIGPRGGAAPQDVRALADLVAAAEGLALGGLMAVAPRGTDPARAYDELAATAAAVRRDHPGATDLSAGMSGDQEAAGAAGATHQRVGTAVFGARPPLG